ncbi:hypothetical protein EAG_04832 [Camponotus floridanus]|uniref:Uncharacterized protein n=1 Tax=Camponotus floridanus TaxID=104421 RepID=E2AGV7_CAMFO|nr:hypothetical protein EAG_04832 [Camponotus floridanus]
MAMLVSSLNDALRSHYGGDDLSPSHPLPPFLVSAASSSPSSIRSITSRFEQFYSQNTFLIRDNVTPIDPLILAQRFCYILFHWIYLSSRRTTYVLASKDNSGSCITPFTIRSLVMSKSRGITRVSGKWDFRRASGHRANPTGPRIPRGTVTRNKGFRECLLIMRRAAEYANIVKAYADVCAFVDVERAYNGDEGGGSKSKLNIEESISDALDRLRHDLILEQYIWERLKGRVMPVILGISPASEHLRKGRELGGVESSGFRR